MKTLGALVLALLAQNAPELEKRWVYYPLDLQQQANVVKLDRVMERSAKAGYNGIVLEDPGFAKLPLMNEAYFETLGNIRRKAEELKLDIIPSVFQIGHSQHLLAQDPNLAEGLPVRDALFVVKQGAARLVQDPPVSFRGKWDRRDRGVSEDWVLKDLDTPLARITQTIEVRPFRQYHISVSIRTKDLVGTPRIVVMGRGKMLNYDLPFAKPTQDWTIHHAVFNSLDCDRVRVNLALVDGRSGELAWSDPRIEEVGLVNVLRRPGAPLVVRKEDGPVLTEGKHYREVKDALLGAAASREAGFEEWHDPPVIWTELPEGTHLRVSYYHPVTMPDHDQVMICPSEPRTIEILRDQAKRLNEIFRPKAFLMTHDEMRVLNWDESCSKRNLTPAEIVADNVRTCTAILRELNPKAEILVWSDMFDPNHNAHDNYYLVRGDLTGTWKGLDKDVIIAAWFFDKRDQSVRWFHSQGFRILIAGYYDEKPERIKQWLDAARPARKKVAGAMYTSWFDKYEDLEAFADFMREYR